MTVMIANPKFPTTLPKEPRHVPGTFLPRETDTSRLQQMAERYSKDDGFVRKDEAEALLKEAGKDGSISAEEMKWLEGKGQKSGLFGQLFRKDRFDADARSSLRDFTQHSNRGAETPYDSTRALRGMKDAFMADDGKLDAGEARAMLGEAMSSGKALSAAEARYLRGVAGDQGLAEDGKQALNDVLQYVEPTVGIDPIEVGGPVLREPLGSVVRPGDVLQGLQGGVVDPTER